jgi:sugar phosphate permease
MTGVMEPEIVSLSRLYGFDPSFYLATLSSAYFYTYSLSQFLVGSLIDYYGIRKVCSLLLLLNAVGALMMASVEPITMIVGRAVIGFSASVAFLSYQRALSLYRRQGEQARWSSLALVVGNLSVIMATYPLRVSLDTIGLSGTLMALALVAAVLSASVFAVSADAVGRRTLREYLSATRAGLARVVGDKHSWGVSVGVLTTYGVGLSFQSSWGQILLSRAFGLSKAEVSFYLMLYAIVFIPASLVSGYLSDNVLKRRKPFLLATAAAMTASWVATASKSLPLMALSIMSLGMSLGQHIVAPVMIREAYDPSVSATSVAFMNTVSFLGTAVLNSVLPQLGYFTALEVSTTLTALGILAVAFLCRETYASS